MTFSFVRQLCLTFFFLSVLLSLPYSGQAQSKEIQLFPASAKTSAANSRVDGHTADKAKVTETLIDASIPEDPVVSKMLVPYSAKVSELEVVIGRLEGDLRKGGLGGGSLGNFVTDGFRAEASRILRKPVLLTVSNSGGMRRNTIAEGELRVRDIFELLPFENALIKIDLTGEQILKLLQAVLVGPDAQSGARITYRLTADKKPELVKATFVDSRGREKPIDAKATYSVVTIDYLYGLGSGRYSILREGKNVRPIGTTLRDALLHYVRSENAAKRPVRAKLDGRFTQVGPGPVKQDPIQ